MDGTDMRRVIVIVASGLALAGCASGGGTPDWFPRFEPAPVSVQLESQPAGAEAKTSTGQSCQTPCAVAMPPDKEFSVTFSLAGYQQQTIPVQMGKPEGDAFAEASLQPNPVAVELAAAPKTPAKRKPARKPAATASTVRPAARPAAARPAARPAAPRPASPAATSQPATVPASAVPAAAPTDPWPPAR
jgi:hypothetical protein